MNDYSKQPRQEPTRESIAIRDQLAEALAAADSPGASSHAEEQLVLHMLGDGHPLEDFSTPSGRAFKVHVSSPPPKPKPGREVAARRWLAAQSGNGESVARRLRQEGGGPPESLFLPMLTNVVVRPL